jgi:hypothetical protein
MYGVMSAALASGQMSAILGACVTPATQSPVSVRRCTFLVLLDRLKAGFAAPSGRASTSRLTATLELRKHQLEPKSLWGNGGLGDRFEPPFEVGLLGFKCQTLGYSTCGPR